MRTATTLLVVAILSASVAAPAATGAAATQDRTVTLTVEVVDQLGNSIGGVTINATWEDGHRAVETAGNGKAFVDVPEGADVALRVEDGRYVRNEPFVVENVSAADGAEEIEVDVALKASLALRVENGSGPVGDATVRLLRDGALVAGGTTDADGEFESGTVEQGEYVLVVRRTGHFPIRRTVTVSGTDERTIELEAGTATVSVRVRDDHFSPPRPVGNASVTVAGIGTQRTVNGVATFAVPVYSDHSVAVTKAGYGTARRSVAVEERDRTVNATIQREPALVVEPANRQIVVGETVEVTVVNAYGELVEGAAVRLDGEAVGETDANGRLRVDIASGGEHELRARADGIASAPVTVTGIATATATASPTPSPSPTPAATPKGALFDLSNLGLGAMAVLIGVALLAVVLFALRGFQ